MLYHIRFFKVPQAVRKGGRVEVSAVATITNDLGDTTFFGSVAVKAQVAGTDAVELQWKPGMRSVDVRLSLASKRPGPLRLSLRAIDGSATDELDESPPAFLSVESEAFEVAGGPAERYAVRSFPEIEVAEETGNAIERHLWDAGIATCRFLYDNEDAEDVVGKMPSRVLELGTGCGLVGLTLQVLHPDAEVVLTDLGDAQGICERNIARNRSACRFSVYDWDDVQTRPPGKWDLVAVTDCTYNPSAYGPLLRALSSVTTAGTRVLLAHKYRDSSEEEFFDRFLGDSSYTALRDTTVDYYAQPVRIVVVERT